MLRVLYSVVALSVCLAAVPAWAQSATKSLARCAAISSPTARLTCYDGAAHRLSVDRPHVDARPAIAGTGKWRVTRKTSPIDDSKNVILALDAEETIPGMVAPAQPTLIVRCKEGKTELYIAWEVYLGLDETEVLTRVDDAPASTETWDISTDNSATFRREPTSFIKHLLGHRRLLAQVTPYDANPALVTFELAGLDHAIAPLRQACGW